jgi:hypothetical protein
MAPPRHWPIGLLNAGRHRVMVRAVERQGLLSTRLFVAASFVVGCMSAVALLGTAA